MASQTLTCPACGREQRPGSLFCDACGVYLAAGCAAELAPQPAAARQPAAVPQPAATLEPAAAPAPAGMREHEPAPQVVERPAEAPPASGERLLRVTVLASGRTVDLPAKAELLVGRADPAKGILPDLDLAGDGGLDAGVSRAHCKIYRQRAGTFIEDLASDNGTFLRGQRLLAGVPYALREGDEVRVGHVQLRITLPAAAGAKEL